MRRVVITGIGAITPIGNSFHESWEGLLKGKNGIRDIRDRNLSRDISIAGILNGFDKDIYLTNKESRKLDPFVHYAIAAAFMVLEDSELLYTDNGNTAIIVGSSRGGITTINRTLSTSNKRFSPYLMPSTTTNMAASYIAQRFKMKGFCLAISNACTSGANAIGEAFRLIKHGHSDVAIAGGTEAPLCELCLEGYNACNALTRNKDINASRPFDINRNGFVLSEGACIIVLEEYERAIKRGANVYAEIVGYGNTTDGFDQVKPDANGEAKAIRGAIKEGGLNENDIGFINTHGTSTLLGDRTESRAINMVFGERTKEIPISANKSMTGHMLAASGAFELASTAMSIKERKIPLTRNLGLIDPDCKVNVLTTTIDKEISTAISNSFGFGGVNAVLALRKSS